MFLIACNLGENSRSLQTATKSDQSLKKLAYNRISDNNSKNFEDQLLEIQKSDNDSLKLSNFLRLADSSLKDGDSLNFRQSNKYALFLSKKLNDTLGLGEVHWNYAIFFKKVDVLDSALYHYRKAGSYYSSIQNEYYEAKMDFNMSYIFFRTRNYAASEVFVIKALNKFKKLGKNKNIYKCYNRLILIDNELGEFESAISHYQKAKFYLDKEKLIGFESEGTLNNLSLVYQKQGKYEEAIEALDEALENESLEIENRNLYAKLIDNRAYNKFLKGDEDVLGDFERTLEIRRELENPAGQVISHLHLAEYYLRETDTLEALDHGREAYGLSKEYGFNRDILASLQMLSRVDPIHANNYMKEYTILNDSLLSEERKIQDKFARIQFETDAYIAENEALERKNVWIILLSTLSVSSVLFFFLLQRQRLKNKTLLLEKEQQEANEQIYKLMSKQQNRMEEGRVQERVRISEELHDGVLARLFGVRIGLGFLKPQGDEKSKVKYSRYLKEMQHAEQEIRALSHALKNDEVSSKRDFPLLVSDLLSEQAEVGRFNHKFTQKPDISWDRVSDGIKINLYRIVQEALHNIIKYSKCENVEVSIRKDTGDLVLEIIDDGVGFVPQDKRKGIGIANMRSRSKQIGATLKIFSNPGQGTRIQIRIPTKKIYDDR